MTGQVSVHAAVGIFFGGLIVGVVIVIIVVVLLKRRYEFEIII